MQTLTQILESIHKTRFTSTNLLQSEVNQFLRKVNKQLPKPVQDAIFLTSKYNIMDVDSIEDIVASSKSSVSSLATKYNIPEAEMETLWTVLKDLKGMRKMMPQYMTDAERKAIELGKLSFDDLTIDLETNAGRNAAAKVYTPLVYKIVNQFVGKSKLSKQELISAGLLGLTNAMNDWEREDADGKNRVTFKTYAGYAIRNQILQDMTRLSHTFKTNNWAVKNSDKFHLDPISFDDMARDEDGYLKIDHLPSIGVEDKHLPNQNDRWESLYKLIENKFSQRDVDVFYRYFGLHGHNKEKSKDIAKSLGMSEGNIRNSIINKMLGFLRKDPRALEILGDLQDIYTESILADLFGLDHQQIIEHLASDDTFILLEELNQWRSKDVLTNALTNAIKNPGIDTNYLETILAGTFEDLDSTFKKNRKSIISFLSGMYPTENMSRKTDVALLDYMSELQTAYQRHKIKSIC